MDKNRDSIDLRFFIDNLISKKYLIVSITLLSAVSAFFVANFLLPKYYVSSAILRKEENFQMSIEFVSSADIQNIIFIDPLVAQMMDNEKMPALKAVYENNQELHLEVKDINPERSAVIANVWADILLAKLRDLKGEHDSMIALEGQLAEAQMELNSTQDALETKISQTRAEILDVELSHAKSYLRKYLDKIAINLLLIRDIRQMESRLNRQDYIARLSSRDIWELCSFQQRLSEKMICSPAWMGDDSIGNFEGVATIDDAKKYLIELSGSAEAQNTELESIIAALETKITQIAVELENDDFQTKQLYYERNQALKVYLELSVLLKELRVSYNIDAGTPKVASEAVPSPTPVGPSPEIYALFAGINGFVICVLFVYLVEWWKKH